MSVSPGVSGGDPKPSARHIWGIVRRTVDCLVNRDPLDLAACGGRGEHDHARKFRIQTRTVQRYPTALGRLMQPLHGVVAKAVAGDEARSRNDIDAGLEKTHHTSMSGSIGMYKHDVGVQRNDRFDVVRRGNAQGRQFA